ncbi:MAG: Hsp20/alpha crystallin family protein [Aeromicrobium sp.]
MTTAVARRPQTPFAELIDWIESEVPFGLKRIGLTPAVAMEDFVDGDTYVLRAELPGIDPSKDVTVTVDDGVLTIRGERQEIKRDKRIQEFQYGSFSRSIRVPAGTRTEDIEASYRDGILDVRVPMAQKDSTAHVIEVKRADD